MSAEAAEADGGGGLGHRWSKDMKNDKSDFVNFIINF
jgi:hypothetical protein